MRGLLGGREKQQEDERDVMEESKGMQDARIVLDSDDTMGMRGCDVDDGLALLYVVGHAVRTGRARDALVAGVCSSYGNNTLEAVHANTRRVLDDLGLPVPLLRGAERAPSAAAWGDDRNVIVADRLRREAMAQAAGHDAHAGCGASEAARFIVRAARERPGRLSLAVTGSTTNLGDALALDPDALTRYRQVVFMGGITETLVVGNRIMDELNLSCDPQATLAAFDAANRGARIVVVTANNCLPAHFTMEDFERCLLLPGRPGGGYLMRTCAYWFDDMKRAYGMEGFCCWDVLVVMYLLKPQLFDVEPFDVVLDPRLLGAGLLASARPGLPQARILLPRIRDAEAVRSDALATWRAALEAIEGPSGLVDTGGPASAPAASAAPACRAGCAPRALSRGGQGLW